MPQDSRQNPTPNITNVLPVKKLLLFDPLSSNDAREHRPLGH